MLGEWQVLAEAAIRALLSLNPTSRLTIGRHARVVAGT